MFELFTFFAIAWAVASFSPMVNIDGSPMCGLTDIHGNPFGVTSYFDD